MTISSPKPQHFSVPPPQLPPDLSHLHPQDASHALSVRDPETFWLHQASQLSWYRPPTRALSLSKKTLKLRSSTTSRESATGSNTESSSITHPHWTWFPGGTLNTCYNCVDCHVVAGNGAAEAIIWESPVTGQVERWSYVKVLEEVEALAGVLKEEGLKKGDTVLVYMPMIPQALIALLSIVRLGALHAVVFGGFSAPALAQRISACKPRLILTASCGIEGSKGPISYKPLVEGAVEQSDWKPEKVIVWQREQCRWEGMDRSRGHRDWGKLVRSAKKRGVKAGCVEVGSEDGAYVIYTSGTTGTPKGVVRDTAGHLVGLNFTIRYIFGLRGPGDVMFCASDIGWVVGHSYILYAPLLAGSTTILLEGKPVGTPDASTFFRILSSHRVSTLFTAPTALRAIRREDPNSTFFTSYAKNGGLQNLKALFLAGERSEPSIVEMYQKLLEKHCAKDAVVIDNWWSSESGSPITALALSPTTGLDFDSASASDPTTTESKKHKPLPMYPGTAGKPMPGFDVRIVDDAGTEVAPGTMGNIVLGVPLGPTAFRTLYGDEERFYKGYLKRFGGRWIDTGDSGIKDEKGYVSVLSRSDDIINVAAHRFSTGAIEQAITSHPLIVESCVVGIPDELKGSLPFAFATLSTTPHPTSSIPSPQLLSEVQTLIRSQIGAIATLGGMIIGKGIIPKTRSGKTLRRTLRELVEHAVHGDFDGDVQFPATIEDVEVVEVARGKVREYFESSGGKHRAIEARAKSKL